MEHKSGPGIINYSLTESSREWVTRVILLVVRTSSLTS